MTRHHRDYEPELPQLGPGRPEHSSYYPHMRGMSLGEFVVGVGVILALGGVLTLAEAVFS